MRARAEEIRSAELAKAESRLGQLADSERRIVDALTSQIVNKLLHLPTVRLKEAAAAGTMVNITFHGVGGDHLSVSREAHEELLRYLASHRDIYWTDTFIHIMQYVRKQQALR